MHPSTQKGGENCGKVVKGAGREEAWQTGAKMTTSGVNHTLRTQSYEPPLLKKTLRPHCSSCTEIARRQRTTGGVGGEGVWGADMGMCVCPQQRHKCFHKCCTNTETRNLYLKKKIICTAQKSSWTKLFLHNKHHMSKNCSLEKYFRHLWVCII